MKKGHGTIISGIIVLATGIIVLLANSLSGMPNFPGMGYRASESVWNVIGAIAVVYGIIDLIIGGIVMSYSNQSIRDLNNSGLNQSGNIKCPHCGISLSPNVSVCPSCHTVINGNNYRGRNYGNAGRTYEHENSNNNSVIRGNKQFCIYCGCKLEPGAIFCGKCGRRI